MSSNGVIPWADQIRRPPVEAGGWPVSVGLLQRAWRAVQAGEFDNRTSPAQRASTPVGLVWSPQAAEKVAVVLGVAGGVGATSVALALATAAAPSRLVECAPPDASGLSTAATAELGEENGWVRGRRESVLLLRQGVDAGDLPAAETDSRLTVVDAGLWGQPAAAGLFANAWAGSAPVVLVVPATVPGLRRADLVLSDLPAGRVCVAGVGSPPRRWPRSLHAVMGRATAELVAAGRWVCFPSDPRLAVLGLSAADLPRTVLAAGRDLFRCLEGL